MSLQTEFHNLRKPNSSLVLVNSLSKFRRFSIQDDLVLMEFISKHRILNRYSVLMPARYTLSNQRGVSQFKTACYVPHKLNVNDFTLS